ncbi:nitrous oxide reductase accessory protein NosL [Acidimangrovimonas pyrenivorans]|uniref:Nitrous oxide reductase accessory protein NosL n=1 Tax=Acidimangrovimonas pyrenivorans TaxID=2030798 RepID=A0ABV7AII0_9RHOB
MCNHSSPASRRQVLGRMLAGIAALGLGSGLRMARADAAQVTLPPPGPRDTCPVCGMFVAKYPEWVTTVQYDDGKADHFDGPKDFFKYLADLEKYAPGYSLERITGMGVTEYYGLKLVDARQAIYVLGSDVLGPMGHELVPLMNDADAADFIKDHAGKKLVHFAEVTPKMLAGLDAGRFE